MNLCKALTNKVWRIPEELRQAQKADDDGLRLRKCVDVDLVSEETCNRISVCNQLPRAPIGGKFSMASS